MKYFESNEEFSNLNEIRIQSITQLFFIFFTYIFFINQLFYYDIQIERLTNDKQFKFKFVIYIL